jgi:hypothetical protein
MQSNIPDLDTAIKNFVKKSTFFNLKSVITFLQQEPNTVYRYDLDEQSVPANPLPPIVHDKKNEILKSSLKSQTRLEESDLDEMSESDIEQDEKERQWNDQAAEKTAWKNILGTDTEDAEQTYKELLKDILQNESYEVKEAIAKKFDIRYKKPSLNTSSSAQQQQNYNQEEALNQDHQQQNDDLEEVKEGASQTSAPQENSLEYLPQDSSDKNSLQTNLGSQFKSQGAASIISGILVKRKAPEGNKLDQGQLNLEETSQTTFGNQGERPRVTLQQEVSRDKNQKDDKNKREQKQTLKDELKKGMQGGPR